MKKKLRLGRAFGLVLRTWPFLLLRAVIYVGSAIGILAGALGGRAVGHWLAGDPGAFFGFWGGAGLSVGVVHFLRTWLLYMVKAGHIAVLVELIDGRPLPQGRGQVAYAKDRVAETFLRANVFFAIDGAIRAVLGVVSGLVGGIAHMIPGVSSVAGFLDRILRVSLGFVDEVILGLCYRTRTDNPWQTSRQGVVLYAQNFKKFLGSAAVLSLVYYVLLVPFFVFAILSCKAFIALTGAENTLWAILGAILMTWSMKKAFIEPLFITALTQLYFDIIADQVPNPEWDAKLTRVSDKFRELGEKATSWVGRGGKSAALPAATAVSAPPAAGPEGYAEPYGQPQAHAQPQVQPQPQPQPQPQAYGQPQAHAHAHAQPQPHAQPYAQPQPYGEPQPYAQPQAQAQPSAHGSPAQQPPASATLFAASPPMPAPAPTRRSAPQTTPKS